MGRHSTYSGSSPMHSLCSEPRKNNASSFSDWIDNTCGMDLLGCADENCSASRQVISAALRLNTAEYIDTDYHLIDYATLHDEFLESLLHEQTKRLKDNDDDDQIVEDESPMPVLPSVDIPKPESPRSESSSTRKRRRPIRLHRRNSPARIRSKTPPLRESSSSNKTVCLEDISKSNLPAPETYMHLHCRMQKDKCKGEPVGSNICAKGRDACLGKLRVKMKILTDVVLDSNKGPATMKRRKAKVAEEFENFTETRSLIELNMGFLSMTYGVLLRWDTGRTGKITFVVLRKMCHESFYPTRTRKPLETTWQASIPNQKSPYAGAIIDQRHAILQRNDGMEVTLVDPPYRVPRPVAFDVSTLSVAVLFATGLSTRSNWTIKLTYEGHSESILLTWDEGQSSFLPKLGDALKQDLASLNLSSLQIKVYEHRLRRRHYRRLISTMHIPLNNLQPQRSSRIEPIRLMIPCKHDASASIALGLVLCSDYGHWLSQELEARGREEVKGFAWRPPFIYEKVEDDEDNHDAWDWICSVC